MIPADTPVRIRSTPADIVWVHPGPPIEAVAQVECMDLATALARAARSVPRSFSVMVGAAAVAGTPDAAVLDALRRASRVVVCDVETPRAIADLLARSRLGLLPPPFDTDAFALALDWLAAG